MVLLESPFLLLLIELCPVFYPVCLFSCDVNVQSIGPFAPIWRSGSVSHSLRSLQAGYHPSCLHDLSILVSCDILNLADAADVFIANSILQTVASDASSFPLLLVGVW
jgi:hypothetical protein